MIKIEDYLSEAPLPRFVGTEHEYNFQSAVVPEHVMNQGYEAYDALGIGKYTSYLSNGARVYVELSQIEYASPECTSGREVDLAQRAGLVVINAVIDKAFEVTNRKKEPGKRYAHRGLYDRAVTLNYKDANDKVRTTGYHENYTIPVHSGILSRIRTFMPTFLATRPVWSGSGYLGHQGFRISQKASGIGALEGSISGRTREGSKPMYMITTDGAPGEFRRYEVRMMDPSHSTNISALGIDSTSLALRLMETPFRMNLPELPLLDSPVDALHQIAQDTTLSQTYELTDGRHLTAVEIQLAYAEAANELGGRIELPAHEQAALRSWYGLLEALHKASGDAVIEDFADSIGWVARRQELVRRLGVGCLSGLNSRSAMLDMLWDRKDCYDLGGKAYDHQLTDSDRTEIQERIATPPPNTRAHIRGRYLAQDVVSRVEYVSWETIKLRNQRAITFAADGSDITPPLIANAA